MLYSLTKNKVNIQNSPYGFGGRQSYEYYSLKRRDDYILEYDVEGWEDDLMSLYFIEDENEEEFTREVLTIINILESLGGFFEIILFTSALVIRPVNSFLFQSNMVTNLYLE